MQRYEVLLLGGERFQIDADGYRVDEEGARFYTEGPEERIGQSDFTHKPIYEVGRVAPGQWIVIRHLGDNAEA